MSEVFIPRTFWFEEDGKNRQTIQQNQILTEAKPVIILGEPGMGKSTLLHQLRQQPNTMYFSARRLIHASKLPSINDSTILIVDALDEVGSKKDGEALDQVLAQMESLGNPQFVLSCRVSDWQSATGLSLIEEFYGCRPLALHLSPFDQTDMLEFLQYGDLMDEKMAVQILDHFHHLGLEDLLGNPQSLSMIKAVADAPTLPNSRNELYQLAVEKLASEHNDKKSTTQLSMDELLDTAGAIFATQILTAHDAISRKAIANIELSDLSITDLKSLPDTSSIDRALDSRLFQSIGTERFSYCHRSIGEYLGARWLAKQAKKPRQKRRLLSLLRYNNKVPVSLRGIHAWLIQNPDLAPDIIGFDPLSVIEHSCTDGLSESQANTLLDALTKQAEESPHFFNWQSYSLKGLINKQTMTKAIQLAFDKEITFSLRMVLLQAFSKSPLSNEHLERFTQLIFDTSEFYAIRSEAMEILPEYTNQAHWEQHIQKLLQLEDNDSLRLASNYIERVDFDINDELAAKVLIKYAQANDNTVLKLAPIRDNLPLERVPRLLNTLSKILPNTKLGDTHYSQGKTEISELVCALILRLIEQNNTSVEQIWYWLSSTTPNFESYKFSKSGELSRVLHDSTLKQDIQLLVHSIEKDNLIPAGLDDRLQTAFPPLSFSEEDIIAILERSPAHTIDWKGLIQLCRHDRDQGKSVRAAAQKFVQTPEEQAWLEAFATSRQTEWEIRRSKQKELDDNNRARKIAQDKEEFLHHIEELREGVFSWVYDPARAYLQQFRDVGKNMPPHERIADWLGGSLSNASLIGIEAFLIHSDRTFMEIAEAHAENKYYHDEDIFIVAIAERLRREKTLSDLSDQKLFVCLFSCWGRTIHDKVGIGDIELYLESEALRRDLLKQAYQYYIELNLKHSKSIILPLDNRLLKLKNLSDIACELSSQWLLHYELSQEMEKRLIMKLIQQQCYAEIQAFLDQAPAVDNINQQLFRRASRLLCCFATGRSISLAKPEHKTLLWSLQELFPTNPSVPLLQFTISTFRDLWSKHDSPKEEWTGRNCKWEASKFTIGLIRSLGTHSASYEAENALLMLRDEREDSYSSDINQILSEQQQRIAEQKFSFPDLKTLQAVITDSQPTSMADLQAYMLEELAVVQAKIRSNDTDCRTMFFDDNGKPFGEEKCRDRLLDLLRQGINDIELAPEAHVANEKRVDITCSIGSGIRLPIEIKGQWHKDLWTAADIQLDALYSKDHRAEDYGIYLVFWFGPECKKPIKGRGKQKPLPMTPKEMKHILEQDSYAVRSGKVKVVVLDMT